MQKTTFLVLGEAFGFEWRDNVLQETEATGVGEAFNYLVPEDRRQMSDLLFFENRDDW